MVGSRGAGRAPLAVAAVLGLLLLAGGTVAATVGAGRGGARFAAPADGGAGPAVVELSPDAMAHPAGAAVRAQLQAHYDSINRRDYAAWRDTVVPARAEALPEAAWVEVYASTVDGSVRVDRIDDVDAGETDGALLVRVRFVSTQDVADAPPDVPAERICWRSTLPMTGAPPRIDRTQGGSSIPEAC